MPTQRDGTYHLSGFEITREQHRYLKLTAALNDCSIKDLVTKKVFDPADMKAVNRRAQIIADLQAGLDTDADIEADNPEPLSTKTGKESAACAEPQPDKIVATPPPQSPKRTKAERKAGRPTRSGPGDSTPVTDSLTEEERERIAAACAPQSYTMDGDGSWDREEDSNRSKRKRLTDELIDDSDDIEDEDDYEEEEEDVSEIDFND